MAFALHEIQAAPVAPVFAEPQPVTSAACSSALNVLRPLKVRPRGRRRARCSGPRGTRRPSRPPTRHVVRPRCSRPASRVRREVTRGDPAAPIGHRARLNLATSPASLRCPRRGQGQRTLSRLKPSRPSAPGVNALRPGPHWPGARGARALVPALAGPWRWRAVTTKWIRGRDGQRRGVPPL